MRLGRGVLLGVSAVALAGLAALSACRQQTASPPAVQKPADPPAAAKPAEAPVERARFDFSLKDATGSTVALASFKGHPLIINFWATYCGPCKAEIPVFNDLVVEHRADHLAVIGISYDDAPADIVAFTKATPMHYPVLVGLGHDDLMDAYEAGIALPTTWVIRGDGTVVAKHVGPETRDWFEAQVKAAF